jgi:hypothetical protein
MKEIQMSIRGQEWATSSGLHSRYSLRRMKMRTKTMSGIMKRKMQQKTSFPRCLLSL